MVRFFVDTGLVYRQWLQLRFHFLALSPQVENFLCKLKERGYRLGLITNGPSRAQWEKVHVLKLECFFDIILVSGDLPWEKPEPNIFMEACNVLNVDPKSCLMVGDKMETDIIGGRILGATVWVNPQEDIVADYYNDLLHQPDFILREVTELAFILQIPISTTTTPDFSDDSSSNSSVDGS